MKANKISAASEARKIAEHTYGSHAYMKIEIAGELYEVDCYFRADGEYIKTSVDGTAHRQMVIEAFHALF